VAVDWGDRGATVAAPVFISATRVRVGCVAPEDGGDLWKAC
jgi:hypothetical protein